MTNTNAFSNQKRSCGQLEIFLYRAPKKNHDEMVEVNRQSRDFFSKHGASGFEVFSLASGENVMEFENLSKSIPAGEDEEVWGEIQSYRDAEHVKEFTASIEVTKVLKRFTNGSWN
jgi:hypothetical protein